MSSGGIRVHLLGGLTVYLAGGPPVIRFPTQKTAALLALLALPAGRRYPREVIIDRLWPDATPENGRRSLRVALSALRRILEPPGTPPDAVLVANRETVSLRAEAVSTDVAEFEAALRSGDKERADDLYSAGPLLPAFYEDWVLAERDRLEEAHVSMRSRRAAIAVAEPVALSAPSAPVPAPRDLRERLPLYLTRFIGRNTEIETLTALWDDPANRLITLTGPGGVGKTHLLVHAAALARRGGACPRVLRYVPLADAHDRVAMIRAIAAAVGLDPAKADAGAVLTALESLGEVRLLLDNLEQLVEAGVADMLGEWLAACPGLQVVATSRQRLPLPGEREVPLLPFETPASRATPERLLDFDAVRLLLDRARVVRSDAQLTPRNAETVRTLCERLGGLPLALELTAAWAGVLTFGQMLARVEAHLLDEPGPPTAHRRAARPERHRTLRAALETSLGLLTPGLRAAFVDLSVFRGGFTGEAAQAVLGKEIGAAETLSRLRERSLLVAERDEESDAFRFRFMPALYALARESRDEDPGRARTLAGRHLDYYLRLAETPRVAEAALDPERENFRAALDAAEASGGSDDLRLCAALLSFWDARGHSREGWERTARAIARQSDADPDLLLRAHHCAGKLAYNVCEFAASRSHHECALALAEARGNPAAAGRALQGIASCVLYADTDLHRAIALCDAARKQYQLAGDAVNEARLLQGQAVIAQMRGDYDAAFALQTESLRIAMETGDDFVRANAHQSIGGTLTALGRLPEAAPHLEAALAIFTGIGSREKIANTLHEMGTLAYEQGDYETTGRHYEDALNLYRALGELWATATCLSNLGRLSTELGDTVRGAEFIGEALNLRVRLGDKHALLQSIDAVINLLIATGMARGGSARRALATEAVRLRAADRANRAALQLANATPDDRFAPEAATFRQVLGAEAFDRAEAEGGALSLEQTVAAARIGLGQIR